jgi:hypothetical protein
MIEDEDFNPDLFEELEHFEKPAKRKRQTKNDEHYVNNKEFTLALDKYARESKEAIAAGKEKPVMSRYLAECIMKMSFRLSLTPRFQGYPFREEMVQNGILAAVKYAYRFDGDRFDNGFAYITQILFSHMVITIKNEKKRYKTNLELIQQAYVTNIDNPEFADQIEEHARFISDQKLTDLKNSELEPGGKGTRGGFTLRTGWTKEARDAYKGGTPLVREDEEDDKNL